MAQAEEIRQAVVKFMGDSGRRFQTRDISNSEIGKNYKGSNIGSALHSWAERGMLVNGYALSESREIGQDGGRRFWKLEKVAGGDTAQIIKDADKVIKAAESTQGYFAGEVLETKKGSMLVRSGDRLYTVTPLNWG